MADAFNVGERNVRTWFAFNQRQTPFLRPELDSQQFVARTILAKCLITLPAYGIRGFTENILIKGVRHNLDGTPLRPLLELPNYYADYFHWEFNAHLWNPNNEDDTEAEHSFHLIWYYGAYSVPAWLPEDLRPDPDLDRDTYGPD